MQLRKLQLYNTDPMIPINNEELEENDLYVFYLLILINCNHRMMISMVIFLEPTTQEAQVMINYQSYS